MPYAVEQSIKLIKEQELVALDSSVSPIQRKAAIIRILELYFGRPLTDEEHSIVRVREVFSALQSLRDHPKASLKLREQISRDILKYEPLIRTAKP